MAQQQINKVQPGRSIREALRASFINETIETNNWARQFKRGGIPRQTILTPTDTNLVKILNSSGAARSAGEILELNGFPSGMTAIDPAIITLNSAASITPGIAKQYVVLLEAVPNAGYGYAQIAGIVRATVNITNSAHRCATVTSSNFKLQSAAFGPVELVYQPSGTSSTAACLVRLPTRWSTTRYKGLMQGALSSGDASKTVDNLEAIDGIGGETSLTAYNTHGWAADDNAEVRIEYVASDARWEMYQVTCPA